MGFIGQRSERLLAESLSSPFLHLHIEADFSILNTFLRKNKICNSPSRPLENVGVLCYTYIIINEGELAV